MPSLESSFVGESPCSLFESGAQRQGRGREPLGGAATLTPMSGDGTGWDALTSRALGWGWGEWGCLGSLLGIGRKEKGREQE